VAYVREYRLKNGTRRFAARCLGADGKYREESGFTSRRTPRGSPGNARSTPPAGSARPPPPAGRRSSPTWRRTTG
jgi:hypothetical protein